MAKALSEEDKIQINELYLIHKTYAEVARQTGFSPSTVKKYVVKDYIGEDQIVKQKFIEKPEMMIVTKFPSCSEEWLALFAMTEEEKQECDELRKEILI